MKGNSLAVMAFLLSSIALGRQTRLIETTDKFHPDGQIDADTEVGTINGVNYRFSFVDGSGRFAGYEGSDADPERSLERMISARSKARAFEELDWDVACGKDPITDEKHCRMTMRDLRIFVYGDGRRSVRIGYDHFPGSTAAFRSDDERSIISPTNSEGRFRPSQVRTIIEKLSKTKRVTTRYMEWPKRVYRDESWSLYGFNETYRYITWAVTKIK